MTEVAEQIFCLDGEWKVKDFPLGQGIKEKIYLPEFDKKNFLSVQIPGTARQALLANNKIPDPYFGFNNEESLWVEFKEWWFCKDFEIGASKKGSNIDLVFEGTVFQGEVWLNGSLVGELKGMFNPRAFPVSHLLNFNGKNHIAVRLEAPEDARNIKKWNGLTFDFRRNQLYSIAQCLFAWDWAPHMVPVGIWQSVKLRITGPLRLEKPQITTSLPSHRKATVSISIEVKNLSNNKLNFRLDCKIKGKNFTDESLSFEVSESISAQKTQRISQVIEINDPKLWWPNGLGEPNLYLANVILTTGNQISDSQSIQFGIRELKMVPNDDVESFVKSMKSEVGNVYQLGKVVGSYPWTFEINGVKMFAKGGNWIPADQMLRLNENRYQRLLQLARDAHFNALRVWGGGLYETEAFYNLCDEYGILVWQEFLSNCNFSQIDRENFLEGAQSAILRLRNHPSLAFYCGGNEFDPDDEGSKTIIDSLEKLIKELDPEKEFHRASPYMGDDHHWGVWHGKEPYTSYRKVRPFRSEAGVNTFPIFENYRKFTPDKLLWPLNQTYVEYHGENNTRFHHLSKLERYANEFGNSNSIEEFIAKSQLYQALANCFNMEFCRAHKFKNSGLLYWQYNDSWPCISWALIDWYGTPKPGYFFVKRASRPLHVGLDFKKYLWNPGEMFESTVFLLNDNIQSFSDLSIHAAIFDIRGSKLFEKNWTTSTDANISKKIAVLTWQIPENFNGRTFFITAKLSSAKNGVISETIYPIAVSQEKIEEEIPVDTKFFKNIFSEMNKMPPIKLQVVQTKKDDFIQLKVKNETKFLAFFVHFKPQDDSLFPLINFNDNYFALMPNESKIINVGFTIGAPKNLNQFTLKISGWNVLPDQMVIKV